MPLLGERELKTNLRNADIGGIYFIFGNESYLKAYYSGYIAKKVVQKDFEDFNLHVFEGKETSIDKIAEAVEAMPVFSEKSCVLVKDLAVDSLDSVEFNKLTAIISDVPQSCVLILLMDSIAIDRKKSSWSTILKISSEKGYAIELKKRDLSSLIELIEKGTMKRGLKIDYNTAKYFVSVVGDDMNTLLNELEKVCAYDSDKIITKEDIDAVTIKSVEARVFDLAKSLLANNFDSAYRILDTLFQQKTEPLMIMGALNSSFVDIYRVKAALIAGERPEKVAEYFEYKGKEFRLKDAVNHVSKIPVNQLRKCLDELNITDELLKSSSIDSRLLVEQTMVKLLIAINEG